MSRPVNWATMRQALQHGHIVTPEEKARILKARRETAEARAARRAELARTAPERAKLRVAHAARRLQCEKERTALRALSIGDGLVLPYLFSSQLGPMLARIRILDGLHFTCRAVTGQGVYIERINPPHARPASADPNGDLL